MVHAKLEDVFRDLSGQSELSTDGWWLRHVSCHTPHTTLSTYSVPILSLQYQDFLPSFTPPPPTSYVSLPTEGATIFTAEVRPRQPEWRTVSGGGPEEVFCLMVL